MPQLHFLSLPVLMHGHLLSVHLWQILEKKSLGKNSYLRNHFTYGHQILYGDGRGPYLTVFGALMWVKGQRSPEDKVKGPGPKVKVNINVKEKAVGLSQRQVALFVMGATMAEAKWHSEQNTPEPNKWPQFWGCTIRLGQLFSVFRFSTWLGSTAFSKKEREKKMLMSCKWFFCCHFFLFDRPTRFLELKVKRNMGNTWSSLLFNITPW